jgi:DNA-binding transcriptional ArsR family regulator
MANYSPTLDRVFHCLAHATRRRVLEALAEGPSTMTDLAEPGEMAMPSFLQHLQILEEAGLVRSVKNGRVRSYELNPPSLLLADNWLDRQRKNWTTRLDQLDQVLTNLETEPENE